MILSIEERVAVILKSHYLRSPGICNCGFGLVLPIEDHQAAELHNLGLLKEFL